MTSMTYHTRSRSFRRGPGDAPSVVKKGQRSSPTTTIERLLLMAMIVIFPLDPYLPAVGRFSFTYIVFAISAGYVLLRRPATLARTWIHPVFLAAFVLLILGALIESAHPLSSYSQIARYGQMFVAAIFVASLCRDRRALHASIYGFLIASILVSILLFATTYGVLRQATATDFSEAAQVRHAAMENVEGNANALSIFASQGATVALALALMARSPLRRNLFLGITLFCAVATFLPMSRSGIVILGASCATVMFAYGVRHVRVLFIAAVLAVGGLIWVPEAVFARLELTPETRAGGAGEARMRIYKAAIDHLPEYILTGVGAGNFKGPWGEQTAYYKHYGTSGAVLGAHNAFIQITIFWGLTGLLMLIVVVYLAYRCLPRGGGKDVLVLCLYGIAVVFLSKMMFSHVLAAKSNALVLGLLVGGHRWIWPKGITLSARRGQGHRYPALEHTS
jgi:O-Antigen ligase